MINFFKRVFGSKKPEILDNLQISTRVTTYVNGKQIERPHSRKILREPNLTENIYIPAFSKEFNKDIKIQDSKDLRRRFLVNLFTMSCTCQEFQKKQKSYSPTHLKRICQHLKDAMDKPLSEKDPFLRRIVASFYNKPAHYFYFFDFIEKHVIYFTESSNWVNIITEHNPDTQYAYNIIEKRWSSEGIPDKAKSLVSEISNIIYFE